MKTINEQLKDALISLEEGISKSDAPTIATNLSFLDQALQNHRTEIDSELKHYLKRRSYQKALMYLEGQGDIPKGACQGRKDFS